MKSSQGGTFVVEIVISIVVIARTEGGQAGRWVGGAKERERKKEGRKG